ncbi:hypothetical protein [Intestinirhabdus alba]|uniref:hypothetical protein n=1 Tax=Intestinirhabdus alba TaxID=2899544 RepID=UPI0038B31198
MHDKVGRTVWRGRCDEWGALKQKSRTGEGERCGRICALPASTLTMKRGCTTLPSVTTIRRMGTLPSRTR